MDTQRLNRIRFRAWRRGFREADLILGGFADACLPSLSEEDVARFERLLEQPDHDIYAWILGRAPAPPAFDDELLQRIRAFRPGEGQQGPQGS
ncbi:MAG TPA: succinate dehydrogenase assembly factor 2 [Caulobacteraceae bacterium]|jgi:antitoxin CptB